MGKISDTRRHSILKKRSKKRAKIKKLKEKYLSARAQEEKERIIAKALKVNPHLVKEDFLSLSRGG